MRPLVLSEAKAGRLNQPVLFLGAEDNSAAFSQCLADKALNAADLDAALGVW